MSKPSQTHQHPQPCSLQLADEFLNSDDYRIEESELITHLDTCDQCREYLEGQAATKAIWNNLSTLLQPGEFDEAGLPDFSAATIGHIGQKPVAAQDVLDALAPTDDPHKLGRLGNYEVTGVVGVGGMGVVLKAVDPSLDRVVAIKVMAPQLANNENARKRFAREAKAAAAVLHPNVIPIHSVSSGAALPYLVMSYIRGGSLQKRLEQQGPMPVVEVLRIGVQVASGLAAAHDQGLVHRDIKPENILLEEGVERVTITDFGLARAVDDNTVTQYGTIAGTPQYMSPEQARGEQVDQQSDLFSLGSVLYALCTGTPPYKADTSYGVMRKIIDEQPVPLRQLHPSTPEWMANLVNKLMAKDKADRFESAAEVHKLLELCLNHMQQPSVVELPDELNNTVAARDNNVASAQQKSFAKSLNIEPKRKLLTMKTILAILICGSTVLLAIPAAFVAVKSLSPGFGTEMKQDEVRAPLSELDSYIVSIMTSPHDLVFLNLAEIGPEQNYLTFMPTTDGVQMRLPAFPSSSFDKRQSQYAEQLKRAAESLSLTSEDKSEFRDGKIAGVNINVRVTGDPQTVANTVRKLVDQTFSVEATSECRYTVHNLPSESTGNIGAGPKLVSGNEFVREHDRGERVYFGEVNNKIYLIPKERRTENKLQRDEDVWYTDINDLPSGFAARIRSSFLDTTLPQAVLESQPELKLVDNGSDGTTLADTTVHSWNLEGHKIGEFTVQLLLAQNGKANVIDQFEFSELEQDCSSSIRLVIKDTTGEGHQRTLSATLDAKATGLSPKGHTRNEGALPVTIEAPFSNGRAISGLTTFQSGEPKLLFAKGYWKGDFSHQDSIAGMIDGSSRGGTFLYVTVDWKPASHAFRRTDETRQ